MSAPSIRPLVAREKRALLRFRLARFQARNKTGSLHPFLVIGLVMGGAVVRVRFPGSRWPARWHVARDQVDIGEGQLLAWKRWAAAGYPAVLPERAA